MPKILEIKKIDGEIWCKVPLEHEQSPIHLYTDSELRSRIFGERLVLLSEIEEWIKERRKTAY